eukprot:NODE_490_length_7774_cov_0.196352.p2 type:complete len:164 gc:universal NODE_490_length_7774_cov_0.196352:4574-5065(+)
MNVQSVHVPAHVVLQIQHNITAHIIGYCKDEVAYVTQICPTVPPNQNTASSQFQQVYLSYLSTSHAYGIPIGWTLKGELFPQTRNFHKQLNQALFGAILIQYVNRRLVAFNGEFEEINLVVESNPLLTSYILQNDNAMLSYSNADNDEDILKALKKPINGETL